MGGVIVRDLSIAVSNYRSNMTLDAYLKQQKARCGGWGRCAVGSGRAFQQLQGAG